MSTKGSSRRWFDGAVQRGNVTLVDQAAREMLAENGRLALADALAVCIVLGVGDDDRFDRAAARWIGRFALERPSVELATMAQLAVALDRLPQSRKASVDAIVALAAAHHLDVARLARLPYLEADEAPSPERLRRRRGQRGRR